MLVWLGCVVCHVAPSGAVLLEAVERSDRAGDGGACTGGGGGVNAACGRGGDDVAASSTVGGEREGDDMALAIVCLTGDFWWLRAGGGGGCCWLCVLMYCGEFFLGPLELQGERVAEDRDGVNFGGDHIGAAAAASWYGPPAAAAADGHRWGCAANSPSLASSSDEHSFLARAVCDIRVLRDWRERSSSSCWRCRLSARDS
jgi:hypothetical protein